MESKGLSALAFAEKLGIQRSGLSHIFGGRNKPSLDLILKILEVFPDVSPEWLLKGEGNISFIEDSSNGKSAQLFTDVTQGESKPILKEAPSKVTEVTPELQKEVTDVIPSGLPTKIPGTHAKEPEIAQSPSTEPEGKEEITVLYPDGTFRIFKQR